MENNNSDRIDENVTITKPTNEPCPQCEVIELMIAIGTASTACNLLEDDNKRDECRSWAAGLDPEKVESAQDVIWDTIQKVGVDPVAGFSTKWNDLIQTTIIKKVGDKVKAGEQVDPKLEQLFKVFSSKRGV